MLETQTITPVGLEVKRMMLMLMVMRMMLMLTVI